MRRLQLQSPSLDFGSEVSGVSMGAAAAATAAADCQLNGGFVAVATF